MDIFTRFHELIFSSSLSGRHIVVAFISFLFENDFPSMGAENSRRGAGVKKVTYHIKREARRGKNY